MDADFSEVEAFAARLDHRAQGVLPRASQAVRKTALDIVADAQQLAPVDTGATKSSIYASFADGGLSAEIGPTTHYAPYLEHGTVRSPAQPFMYPAAQRQIPGLRQALGELGADL